jgi:undecaprenyl pyrophosphate phosphatase UppP
VSKNEILFDLATVIISAIIGAIVALGIVQLIKPYLHEPENRAVMMIIDDYLTYFQQFCQQKGYESASIFVNSRYCFVMCSAEKNGWRKDECFSKEDFRRWLNG